jgi:hypothetical protein
MINAPKTIEEARALRYRTWGGNPKGYAYREGYCAESVPDGGRSVLSHQCERKNGHGPDGLYCKQHAKRYTDSD